LWFNIDGDGAADEELVVDVIEFGLLVHEEGWT
jgi:hypothetical protein